MKQAAMQATVTVSIGVALVIVVLVAFAGGTAALSMTGVPMVVAGPMALIAVGWLLIFGLSWLGSR